jgi:hypothetical protein
MNTKKTTAKSTKSAAQPGRSKVARKADEPPLNLLFSPELPSTCEPPRVLLQGKLKDPRITASGTLFLPPHHEGNVVVYGLVQRTNDRVRAQPPKGAVKALCVPVAPGDGTSVPDQYLYDFAVDYLTQKDHRVPGAVEGADNRLIVWARFRGRRGAKLIQISQITLQFEGVRQEKREFLLGPNASTVGIPQPNVPQPVLGGKLTRCSGVVARSSNNIVAAGGQIFATEAEAKAATAPSNDPALATIITYPSPRTGFVFENGASGDTRIPGVTTNNYLVVWVKYTDAPSSWVLVNNTPMNFRGVP